VPAQEQDKKHDDHDDHDDSEADKHGLLLSLSADLTTVSQDGGRETRARMLIGAAFHGLIPEARVR
jgi:hypothetical protein